MHQISCNSRLFLVSHRIEGYASPFTNDFAVSHVTNTTFPSSLSGCNGTFASRLQGTSSRQLELLLLLLLFLPQPDEWYAHFRQDGG